MTTRRPRAELVPNANNPRLLHRLIDLVAAGLRRPGALAEVLDVELRTVHYYTQAAEWLDLISTHGGLHLTPRGVELAFATPRQRGRVYADAIYANPFVAALLEGHPGLPDNDVIANFISGRETEMAAATARRRASAVRSLIEPATNFAPRATVGRQMALPFLPPAPSSRSHAPTVNLRAGRSHNPDVYARFLFHLLDHGELRTGQVRALLDHMGATDCSLADYAEMAVARGDASRVEDRLVVTAGAIQRRALAAEGTLIAFSDPEYRRWLRLVARPEPPTDPHGRREADALAARFKTWDRRIFGRPLVREAFGERLDLVQPGRSPESLPLAGEPGPVIKQTEGPFLECIAQSGLAIAFPGTLAQAAGGVSAINAQLRRVRDAPAAVRLPCPVDPRVRVHGGLLAPGERPPRAIPDNLSLRLRALTHAPAIAMLAALLLLDRRSDTPVELKDKGRGAVLRWRRRDVGPLMASMHAFARDQGWYPSVPPHGALDDRSLEGIARGLGVVERVGKRMVMSEGLFLKLQEDHEARLVYEALLPLADRMHRWLEQVPLSS